MDAFWSISAYNSAGFFEPNPQHLYSVNSVTGVPNEDGSITVRFMANVGDDALPNCIVTPQSWNYLVRLYRPRAEFFDGTWTVPSPTPISGPKDGRRPSWVGEKHRANGDANFSWFTAVRWMLNRMDPSGGIVRPGLNDSGRGRRAVALLLALHGIELIGLVIAAGVTARLARAQPGHGAGLPTLMVLAAMALVGWQGYRLLRARRSLNVSGLAVQSAILMAAIAVATRHVGAGGAGIAVACAVLAGWGRLAKRPAITGDVSSQTAASPQSSAAPPQGVQIEASGRASQIGTSGALLALLTTLVVLAALSVRSGIVFGLVVLAVIFIPLERMFALHPRRVLRQGWRTDLVHYLVNGAALKVSLVVAVVAVGGTLRVFVPAPLRMAVGASPGWVQIVAGLAIAMVGGYAGHRAAHEVPLLWRFHRVHHSVREMDWLAANHLHPLDETFVRSAAVLPLYALGFGRLSLGAFIVLITLQAIFIHANVRMTFGPLRWVIATPQFHHWHHAREPQAYNTNYAGEFPVLDAVFGTLYLPADRWPAQYGVDGTEPAGYLRQLAWPLLTQCAGRSTVVGDRLSRGRALEGA